MNEYERARPEPIHELYSYWCNDVEPIQNGHRTALNSLLDSIANRDTASDIIMDYSEVERRRCFFGGFRMALAMIQEGYS